MRLINDSGKRTNSCCRAGHYVTVAITPSVHRRRNTTGEVPKAGIPSKLAQFTGLTFCCYTRYASKMS